MNKRKNNLYYFDGVFASVLCVMQLVSAALHPRVIMLISILFSIGAAVLFFIFSDADKYSFIPDFNKNIDINAALEEAKKCGKRMIITPLKALLIYFLVDMIVILGILGGLFSVFDTRRAPWEYSGIYEEISTGYFADCAMFPESLPESAENVVISDYPSILQSAGVIYVSFTADDAYVSDVSEQAEKKAVKTLKYGESYYVAADGSPALDFKINDPPKIIRENPSAFDVYVLFDNGSFNHHRSTGVIVSKELDSVCFFAS